MGALQKLAQRIGRGWERLRPIWRPAIRRVDFWIRVSLWLIVVNLFHLAALAFVYFSSFGDQARDAAQSILSEAASNWVLKLLLPVLVLCGLLSLSATAVGVAVRDRLGALARRFGTAPHRTEAAVVIVVPLILSICAAYPSASWSAGSGRFGLIATLGLLIALITCVIAVPTLLLFILHRKDNELGSRLCWRSISEGLTSSHANCVLIPAIVATALLAIVCAANAQWARAIGSLGIVAIAVAMWAAVLSVVFVLIPLWLKRVPLALGWIVLVLLIGAYPGDAYRVPATLRVPDTTAAGAELLYAGPDEALREWLQYRYPDHEKTMGPIPVVMVAAEGGGIRAAYWTARSLAVMNELTEGRIAQRIFAYSGTSGGALGVATFVDAAVLKKTAPAEVTSQIDRFYSQDLLAPVLSGMLISDPLRYYTGITWLRGRDVGFEDALVKSWADASGSTSLRANFLGTFGRDKTVLAKPPVVFFNATHVQSGRPLVISNLDNTRGELGHWAFYGGPKFGINPPSLTVAQAVHLSARFPGVSPPAAVYASVCQSTHERVSPGSSALGDSGTCECPPRPKADDKDVCHWVVRPWVTVVDGGYYDNTAIAPILSLVEWLSTARERASKRLKAAEQRAAGAAAPPQRMAVDRLLARVSFHVIVLGNDDSKSKPVSVQLAEEAPSVVFDLKAIVSTMANVRPIHAADLTGDLQRTIIRLQADAPFASRAGQCTGAGFAGPRPYDIATRQAAERYGCPRIGDSWLRYSVVDARSIAADPRARSRAAGKTNSASEKCERDSATLPLGWMLSPLSRKTIRCLSTIPGKLKLVGYLDSHWKEALPAVPVQSSSPARPVAKH